tara:strand:+ start:375 stop:656 length:282 start_codon:yes stop_codon:yes gene_type:complete
MITIISKIELEGTDSLKYTDVGHTEDTEVINQINEDYDSTLGSFLGTNQTKIELGIVLLNSFFADYDYVFQARTQVTTIEGLGLIEVTDTNQL